MANKYRGNSAGHFEPGRHSFGICACGLELPQLAGGGYGQSGGKLLYAENGMQPMVAIMSHNTAHDVIEYYHVGYDEWQESRIRGGCLPSAEWSYRNEPEVATK